MKYSTLILDFDGTLADTSDRILQSMKFVADALQIKDIDEEQIKSLIGLPLKTTFKKAFLLEEEVMQEATLMYRTHYKEHGIDTISLFEGVKDTLFDFYRNGIRLTVASSKGRAALIKTLKKQNVYDLFSFVGGEEDAKNKKPAPDMVHLIMDAYKDPPDQCLVVGDTVFDIEMGQRARVATCGVTYGNSIKEVLEKLRPTYLVDSFKNLKEIVWS